MTLQEICDRVCEIKTHIKESETTRNVLVASGLQDRTEPITHRIQLMKSEVQELIEKFDSIANDNSRLLLRLLFAVDVAYSLSIEYAEQWKRSTGKIQTEFDEPIRNIRNMLHDLVSGIDAYGLDNFSEVYAEATELLDERMAGYIAIIDDVFNITHKKIIQAQEAGDRRRDKRNEYNRSKSERHVARRANRIYAWEQFHKKQKQS